MNLGSGNFVRDVLDMFLGHFLFCGVLGDVGALRVWSFADLGCRGFEGLGGLQVWRSSGVWV